MSDSKKVRLYIKIGTHRDYPNECGRDCPFLQYDACALFNESLEETQLKDDHVWQNEDDPGRERCYICQIIGD